jgi:glucokinase
LEEKQSVKVRSGANRGARAYFASVVDAATQLGVPDALYGLALPGTFDRDRRHIRYMANVSDLGATSAGIALKDALGAALPIERVAAENDAKCAALAEWARGKGGGDTMVRHLHITWGTGIGTGFIVDGIPEYGWEGGHMPIAWQEHADIACNCGSSGDLEAFASVPHMVATAQRLWKERKYTTRFQESDFADTLEVPRLLSRYAEEGDALARLVAADALRHMARGLLGISVIAYPDLVTIGGAMMDSNWLLEELRTQVAAEGGGLAGAALSAARIERATLGNKAGAVGAAVLARQQLGG